MVVLSTLLAPPIVCFAVIFRSVIRPMLLLHFYFIIRINMLKLHISHIRERHSTQEGGSFVCRYGPNSVCPSLPLDGVDDRDFEAHIQRYHVQPPSSTTTEKWSVYSSSQNLPAVLNDPSRGKQTNLFTKKWGDSFVEKTHIPPSPLLLDITYDDFEVHMQKIGRRFRRHQRLNQMAAEQQLSIEQDRAATSHNG